MTADRSTPASFRGSWRITTMELWARTAMDLLGPAFIAFEDDSMGEFRFIAVQGWMDCRFTRRDGKDLVAFSWQGKDERDDATGRGWAVIEEDGTMSVPVFRDWKRMMAVGLPRLWGGEPWTGPPFAA